MRHGKAFRSLSRPTAHRMLMLRNLVSSLLFHQQVKTTVAKAKEAQRLAEKMIQLGKKGTLDARREAEAFLLNPKDTIPRLFTTYAQRYALRPGGYVRLHNFGHRPGDHAPQALLELVDGPHDIKFAMTARAVGRECVGYFLENGPEGMQGAGEGVESVLRERTRWNRRKVLKYRGEEGERELNRMARDYITEILADPAAHGGLRRPNTTLMESQSRANRPYSLTVPHEGRRAHAGERLSGMDVRRVGLNIAQGALGRRPWATPALREEDPRPEG